MINKDQLKIQKIKQARMLVFACPTTAFSEEEIATVGSYVESGGNVFLLAGETRDKISRANLNALLAQFSIEVTGTAVIRTNYHRYFHPKEALVTNGVMHEDFIRAVQNEGEVEPRARFALELNLDDKEETEDCNLPGFRFVYPHGVSLNVRRPAVPLLNSGTVCYPVNACVLAFCRKGQGAVFVAGSWRLFSDAYLEQEENAKLFDFAMNLVAQPDAGGFFTPDKGVPVEAFNTKSSVPNIEALAEKLKSCIQETPDISHNFLTKFESKLFEANFDHLPASLKLFDQLSVPYGPLKLIPPVFETPMLGLTPSVFPPLFIDLEPPKLELFDLDDEFADQE